MSEVENRRPLKSRDTSWARRAAAMLARAGVSPNAISAMSMVFAAIGGALFILSAGEPVRLRGALLLGAALSIQARLLANLLDGMVAVEHVRGSSSGPIWNELPDRFADLVFLVCAGYAAARSGVAHAEIAGWLAGAGALLTAYVRELGRGLGFPADFSGPMAKPHRMALLTAASVIAAAEPSWGWHGQTLALALAVIALGTLVTVARRTRTLARRLKKR